MKDGQTVLTHPPGVQITLIGLQKQRYVRTGWFSIQTKYFGYIELDTLRLGKNAHMYVDSTESPGP
jgi:hypothetical protein